MTSVFNFTFVPWFRSVAPYIHKFRNQTFVVGIAGEAIAAGKLHPFAGAITDNEGRSIQAKGQTLSDADILNMNFLVDGVVGKIGK